MVFSFKGSKIILGVCGSIAAYKAVLLCRLLQKAGAEVRVVMTRAAMDFVTPLTFSALSKTKVISDLSDAGEWNNHVEAASWADAMVIAPATASSLSKMASGNADNLLLAVYLSAKCPVFFAPAMDLDMWQHPATKANVRTLLSFGHEMIPVGSGELASGLHGEGRMAEPDQIMEFLIKSLGKSGPFFGKNVLVTAGPTRENIDPVRFIGNESSGKMGIALADAFAKAGASVQLILGPSNFLPSDKNVEVFHVVSSDDMYSAAKDLHEKADIVIFSAAVADYKPSFVAGSKIKKNETNLTLALIKTIDIADTLGKNKKPGQIHVGFALETDDAIENGREKMIRKNFDIVVVNSLEDEGAGFQVDTNKISIIKKSGELLVFPIKSKAEVARDIIEVVDDMIHGS